MPMGVGSQLVDIGGRRLFTRVSGNGPVVVLNGGGGAGGTTRWEGIEGEIAKFATVVNYDRAGIGSSDPPPAPPTVMDMVLDLHVLLEALDVHKPFVLLDASMSGLIAQLYACEYPTEIAALVLLDPTPEHTFADFMRYPRELQDRIRSTMLQGEKQMGGGLLLELQNLPESCEQVRAALEDQQRLPDIPIIVLTACEPTTIEGKGSAAGRALIPAHKRIAERTSRGRHILVEGATHMTMSRGEPRDLIVKTVASVVTEVFGGK